jgi:hypothetical protein
VLLSGQLRYHVAVLARNSFRPGMALSHEPKTSGNHKQAERQAEQRQNCVNKSTAQKSPCEDPEHELYTRNRKTRIPIETDLGSYLACCG